MESKLLTVSDLIDYLGQFDPETEVVMTEHDIPDDDPVCVVLAYLFEVLETRRDERS